MTVPPHAEARLVTYFDLLFRWNQKINLTSLTNIDEAIDRLLLEPVAAARELAHSPSIIDLGSGGGSPAIPLALALSAPRLVMVESRSRKAAFLREAVRELGMNAVVEVAKAP
jgi:16S rRNA (guanine527-N7)-methyltransferase